MLFRIAAVSFLNTIPLIDWFESGNSPEVSLTRALPSRLAPLLASGDADVALLPTVELFRGHASGVIPGTGIACHGPVDSVKLFYSGNLAEIHTIHADRGSRTSVALLRVLLAENFHLQPHIQEFEPQAGMAPLAGEGHLVIGDRCFDYESALKKTKTSAISQLDLGDAWLTLTELPFVFAIWCASPNLPHQIGDTGISELTELLNKARIYGTARLAELAAREAKPGHSPHENRANRDALLYYFEKSLRYEIGEQEMAGIHHFHHLCIKHGVIPPGPAPVVL